MKLTFPTEIEQTECRVASLLEFRNDETRANRVNRSCGHENDIVRRHSAPHDKIGDRAIVDGLTQLLRRQTSTKAEGNLGFRSGAQNIPGFGLAPWQAHRVRERIVGVDLDRKWLAREQQLEQERRILRSRYRVARYQISPIGSPSWRALLQGRRSSTPQGFGTGRVRARSIAIIPPDVRPVQGVSIAVFRVWRRVRADACCEFLGVHDGQ